MGQSSLGAAHGVLLTSSSTLTMASVPSSPSLSAVFHVSLHPAVSSPVTVVVVAGLQKQQQLHLLHLREGGALPHARTSRLLSFLCSSNSNSSSGSFSSSSTTTTPCCCCCTYPRSFNCLHSCSASSSGLSNLRISGITHKPFELRQKMEQDRLHFSKVKAGEGSADENFQGHGQPRRTRKVVEHVALFKMKDSLTDEQEKDMLDNLWSLQYQIKNILCTTVGRLVQKTPEGYTHALFSRFPTKQALDEYMESTIRWRVAHDLVIPYYEGNLFVDFEADVDDDIETIFRRGDDFQEGVEHLVFFELKDNVSSNAAERFLRTANALPEKYGDLVQLTVGTNLDSQSKGTYSHALVARLPSEEARNDYSEYLQSDPSWVEATELFETSRTLTADFIVSPVGKAVM